METPISPNLKRQLADIDSPNSPEKNSPKSDTNSKISTTSLKIARSPPAGMDQCSESTNDKELIETSTTATMTTTSAATFPLFCKLPPEVQHLVWDIAAQEPRIIDFRRVTNLVVPIQYYSPTLPPSILSVCCLSRKVALRFYNKIELKNTRFFEDGNICQGDALINQQWYKKSRKGTPEQIAYDGYAISVRKIISQERNSTSGVDEEDDLAEERMREITKRKEELLAVAKERYLKQLVPFRTYINWSQDTLFIDVGQFCTHERAQPQGLKLDAFFALKSWIHEDELADLRHMAVNVEQAPLGLIDESAELLGSYSLRLLAKFFVFGNNKLETLGLVCQNGLNNSEMNSGPRKMIQASPDHDGVGGLRDAEPRAKFPSHFMCALFCFVSEHLSDINIVPTDSRPHKQVTIQASMFGSSSRTSGEIFLKSLETEGIMDTNSGFKGAKGSDEKPGSSSTLTLGGLTKTTSEQGEYIRGGPDRGDHFMVL